MVDSTNYYGAKAAHGRFSDLGEMRAFARRLVGHWERVQRRAFRMKGEFDGAGGGAIIWSFANHSARLMKTVVDLSEQDLILHAVPLVRLMVENTMTAIWIYLDSGNVRHLLAGGFRKRKAAIGNIIETKAEGFGSADLEEIEDVLREFDDAEMPSFEAICRGIEGGLGVYCLWRVLSTYSHAGMGMADFYLEETEEDPGMRFVPEAKFSPHESTLGTAVCMLIASLKLCDSIDYRGSLKSQIEQAEKKMGVSPIFAASG